MKKIFSTVLFLSIISFLYLYFVNGSDESLKNDTDINISQNEEQDKYIVGEFFSEGMSVKDYEKTINYKTKYLQAKAVSYQEVLYNFEKVLTYNEIEGLINALNLSKAVNVEIIGSSVDKRNIYSLEIGFGDDLILIDAGIHAAEIAGTLFITKYIKDLVNDYEKGDSEVVNLLNKIKIIVIPSINPDGYEATSFGPEVIKNKKLHIYKNRGDILFDTYKANANGVDINRNLPSQHGGLHYKDVVLSETVSSKPTLGYFDYYPGESLGSEPETKALIYWLHRYLNNAYAYIALHSAGRVIYSGKPNLSALFNERSFKLAKIVENINGYEALDEKYEDVGTGNDGTATDYASEVLAGFNFSSKTGRLSNDFYQNPNALDSKTGVILIETLERYTHNIKKIKDEYYDEKINKVFDALLKSCTN